MSPLALVAFCMCVCVRTEETEELVSLLQTNRLTLDNSEIEVVKPEFDLNEGNACKPGYNIIRAKDDCIEAATKVELAGKLGVFINERTVSNRPTGCYMQTNAKQASYRRVIYNTHVEGQAHTRAMIICRVNTPPRFIISSPTPHVYFELGYTKYYVPHCHMCGIEICSPILVQVTKAYMETLKAGATHFKCSLLIQPGPVDGLVNTPPRFIISSPRPHVYFELGYTKYYVPHCQMCGIEICSSALVQVTKAHMETLKAGATHFKCSMLIQSGPADGL